MLRAVPDVKEMIKKQIGKRLRDLRQRKGLTQKGMAKMAGVDYTYIGKIERGEQLPSLNVLIRFAECLSLPLDRFFMDEATWRLVSLAPKDVYESMQRENLWELLRLLEGVDRNIACLKKTQGSQCDKKRRSANGGRITGGI